MKKLLAGVFSLMLILAACGGGGDDGGNNGGNGGDTGGNGEETGQQDGGGGETAQAGEQLYQQNCATCHGADLSGGMGPSLKNVGDKYEVADIVNIIQNGKGQMPPQEVSEDDANTIAEWLVNQ